MEQELDRGETEGRESLGGWSCSPGELRGDGDSQGRAPPGCEKPPVVGGRGPSTPSTEPGAPLSQEPHGRRERSQGYETCPEAGGQAGFQASRLTGSNGRFRLVRARPSLSLPVSYNLPPPPNHLLHHCPSLPGTCWLEAEETEVGQAPIPAGLALLGPLPLERAFTPSPPPRAALRGSAPSWMAQSSLTSLPFFFSPPAADVGGTP